MSPATHTVPPDVARRAVEWLLELQSDPVPTTVQMEWARWRAADPSHEQAWQRIEAVNGRLAGLSTPAASAIAHATLAPRGSVRRRQAVTTLAVLFFAGGAAWTAERYVPWRVWTADERTARGERRHLSLDDGTQLVLNGDSALNIAFSNQERRLRLLAGEVLITTAKDARPFLVETAQGEAQALGTRYTVRELAGGQTWVSVFDGAVALRPRHAMDQRMVLQAGQQARFDLTHITAPEAVMEDVSTAWVDGMLVARGMRLADFLAELSRYSAHPLSCDPAVANLRVSGSYPVADVGLVLDTLSATLSLQVETVTRFWGHQVVRVSLAPRA